MFSQVVHVETIPIFLRQRMHLSTPRRHAYHFVLQDDAYNSFNSQVSSWFCRTNDPLICRYPVLNVVVSEKCFKGLPLKFYFRPFDDIRPNRK